MRVRSELLVVRDGPVTTAAAFSAVHDLALDLVRSHHGAGVAEGGYEDPGTFSAVFARHAGHRPAAHRAAFGRR